MRGGQSAQTTIVQANSVELAPAEVTGKGGITYALVGGREGRLRIGVTKSGRRIAGSMLPAGTGSGVGKGRLGGVGQEGARRDTWDSAEG